MFLFISNWQMDQEQITREKEETQQYKLNESENNLHQREKELSELKDAYKGTKFSLLFSSTITYLLSPNL